VDHAYLLLDDWRKAAMRTLYRGTDNPEAITSCGSE
jgi:hypothetical protein